VHVGLKPVSITAQIRQAMVRPCVDPATVVAQPCYPGFDNKWTTCYTMCMVKRKRRSDTTHYIYVVSNIWTGQQYVGVTVKNTGGAYKTLRRRMQKHLQRATAETKNWSLCTELRTWGADAFTFGLLQTVRGRKAAHAVETSIINTYQPALNTFGVK